MNPPGYLSEQEDQDLFWCDLETEGTDSRKDRILEVYMARATLLNPYDITGELQAVLFCSPERVKELDPVVVKMHIKNGLFLECFESKLSAEDVERMIMSWLPAHPPDMKYSKLPYLAGSTVSFDHAFLKHWMPKVGNYFSHKHFDTTDLKLFCRSKGMGEIAKGEAHRGKADIMESMQHMKTCDMWLKEYYRSIP
jgi:oligoribonuclease (3'-5' exoribonuclease)